MSIDLTKYQTVLLDLDGTIYHEDHPLPGAMDLIRQIQKSGQPFACLSNSTSSPQRIAKRLAKMGVELQPESIFTAASAAVDFVIDRFGKERKPRVFNLATEGTADLLHDRTEAVNAFGQACDAVVIGAPANIYAGFDRQRIALTLLRSGALAVGICADRVYPSQRGLEFGSGALTNMLAYAAGVTPVYCGKPEKIFFADLCHHLNVAAENCILIGDNLESDVAGAKGVGMKTILVLSGVAQREDLEGIFGNRKPDWVIESLKELIVK